MQGKHIALTSIAVVFISYFTLSITGFSEILYTENIKNEEFELKWGNRIVDNISFLYKKISEPLRIKKNIIPMEETQDVVEEGTTEDSQMKIDDVVKFIEEIKIEGNDEREKLAEMKAKLEEIISKYDAKVEEENNAENQQQIQNNATTGENQENNQQEEEEVNNETTQNPEENNTENKEQSTNPEEQQEQPTNPEEQPEQPNATSE